MAYWRQVRATLNRLAVNDQAHQRLVLAELPHSGQAGNRVIYRHDEVPADASDPRGPR